MYAITTPDKMEQILFVADNLGEAADFLGITTFGVQSAIRRSKNPKKHMKFYKIFKVDDYEKTAEMKVGEEECEITPTNSVEQAERILDGSDERFVRHHK